MAISHKAVTRRAVSLPLSAGPLLGQWPPAFSCLRVAYKFHSRRLVNNRASSQSGPSSIGFQPSNILPEGATAIDFAASAAASSHSLVNDNGAGGAAPIKDPPHDVTFPAAGETAEVLNKAQQAPKLLTRVVFGLALGLLGGFVVITGRKLFLLCVCLVVYQATKEYYGFITSIRVSQGMTPPPPLVSTATTVLCVSIALVTFLTGKTGAALAGVIFLLLALELLSVPRPRFSTLTFSVFGIFYCGYLPSFWLKLRMLATPGPELQWPYVPFFLQEPTVGLLATFTAVACIVAADTGAYFVGKRLGRTKLTDISPKKTVEGAIGGLLSSVAVALACSQVLRWPADPVWAATLGVLVFISSIFGDLIESIMKRDAAMKDSGDLIPGHGGLLDRFDSYIFTGAVTYFFISLCNYGGVML